MNRRGFLKFLGAMATAIVVAPRLLVSATRDAVPVLTYDLAQNGSEVTVIGTWTSCPSYQIGDEINLGTLPAHCRITGVSMSANHVAISYDDLTTRESRALYKVF